MVMMIPKKRQSSGIPHFSEPFVLAEVYVLHAGKSPRLSGDVRCESWNVRRKGEDEKEMVPGTVSNRLALISRWRVG
jgi:hypothetical protein